MNQSDLYVATAATGNIGRRLTEILLEKKKSVRAVARSAEKLKALAQKGAQTFVGSVDDAAAMTKAFQGATAVFTLIPPNYGAANTRAYQNSVSEAFAAAIKNAGVKFVVNLSSIGANLKDKAGIVNGLHDHEERLNALEGVNVLHVRPAFFMENLFMNIALLKTKGIAGGPLKGDLQIPMIATRDIAAAVAERITARDFSGKSVQELYGQRDLTMNEITKVLGKAVNKPEATYVQFPYQDAQKAMTQMGLSEDVAKLLIELQRNMNDGIVKPTEKRSPKNTTPTSIEDFGKTFAAAYGS